MGVELNCLFPIELVIFKVHLLPPTSSLGPCMIDSSQNDRVSCLDHELIYTSMVKFSLYCTDFPIAKITYSIANMHAYL